MDSWDQADRTDDDDDERHPHLLCILFENNGKPCNFDRAMSPAGK